MKKEKDPAGEEEDNRECWGWVWSRYIVSVQEMIYKCAHIIYTFEIFFKNKIYMKCPKINAYNKSNVLKILNSEYIKIYETQTKTFFFRLYSLSKCF